MKSKIFSLAYTNIKGYKLKENIFMFRNKFSGRNMNTNNKKTKELFLTNLYGETCQNNDFRKILWTGNYMQLTVMSIEPGKFIGLEMHPKNDHMLYIEEGVGRILMGYQKENLVYRRQVKEGDSILIPAGVWHKLINFSSKPIKLFVVYAPPHH